MSFVVIPIDDVILLWPRCHMTVCSIFRHLMVHHFLLYPWKIPIIEISITFFIRFNKNLTKFNQKSFSIIWTIEYRLAALQLLTFKVICGEVIALSLCRSFCIQAIFALEGNQMFPFLNIHLKTKGQWHSNLAWNDNKLLYTSTGLRECSMAKIEV